MDAIAQYFDHYVVSARIKPAFFLVLPLAVTAMVWWPEARDLGGAISTVLVSFGVIGFLSNLISNQGNKLQNGLFSKWGGPPTTLLLRHSDGTLDKYTKERYHRCLEKLVPGLWVPTREEEFADPSGADECYASAVNFLRERTRDKKRYPMIYADNVAYGYARNLLAMKNVGVVLALIALALNAFWLSKTALPIVDAVFENWAALGAVVVSVVQLLIFLFAVDATFVKGRAVRYAMSLLAACEGASSPLHEK